MATGLASGPAGVQRVKEELASARPREHFYVALLGLSTFDAVGIHDRIEAGLSFAALERLRTALDVPMSRLAGLVRVPTRTLARRKEAKRLEADESDRLVRLARVAGLALALFEGDLAQARRWLSAPQGALGDQAPLDLAATEVGAREVEHLVGRLQHGIPL